MAHNRAQLNALIFHNPVVLPRTSPGYAEMTIAIAELQGGNTAKAALYAEAAVTRDPTLAAGWLAKTAADVFEATPGDLRKERAVFCMERALERAPTCRREIVDFFVANIVGHYVEVLCAAALEELAQWLELEAHADELEFRSMSLGWEATQLRGSAALLEVAGLVSGLVSLFSSRLGTQVVAGVASVAAVSEAARRTQYATLLEAMSSDLWALGAARRVEGRQHRSASMFYLVPARELVGLAAQSLRAEGLSSQPLDRLIRGFTGAFREVLGAHLREAESRLSGPIFAALEGETDSLVTTYGHQPTHSIFKTKEVKQNQARTYGLVNARHPVPSDTLLWLEQMFPSVKTLEAHRLLSFPLFVVSNTLYGIDKPHWARSLQQQVRQRVNSDKNGPRAAVAFLVLLLIPVAAVPLVFVWFFGLLTWSLMAMVKGRRRRAFQRAHLRAAFSSVWSVDMWLQATFGDLLGEYSANGLCGQHGPPPLPVLPPIPAGAQGAKSGHRTGLPPFLIGLTIVGSLLFLLVAIGAFLGPPDHPHTPARTATSADAPVATTGSAPAKSTPEIRRAMPVRSSAALPPSAPVTPPGIEPTEMSYSVVGITNGDTLNVRAGPGVNNSIVARLPNGTTHIEVTGTPVMNGPTEWVPIRVGERKGWVTKQHLAHD